MQTLKMKIHSYDEASHSLIVSYASDETASHDPASYQSYAYQPMSMWPDITDVTEIKKRIAHAGIHMAEQQKIQEKFVENQALINEIKNLVGTEEEYQVDQLIESVNSSNSNEVEI